MTSRDVLEVQNLKKWFPIHRSLASFRTRAQYLHAVDSISFTIRHNEIFGLVGESGCGKTTTGRLLMRLIEPTGGKISYEGHDVFTLDKKKLKRTRREWGVVFQDPYKSLNPRMTISNLIGEPLSVHGIRSKAERMEAIKEVLRVVNLDPPEDFLERYPHELSGGQRQRVAIARAIILKPRFIVADEPVSMLDVSIRAGVLSLLLQLKQDLGVSFLYITHDLATARYICNRIAVMYLGKIVETGPPDEIIDSPAHPYSKALISAVPTPDPTQVIRNIPIRGDIPAFSRPLEGCRFFPRCPVAEERCKIDEPQLQQERNRSVRCFKAILK